MAAALDRVRCRRAHYTRKPMPDLPAAWPLGGAEIAALLDVSPRTVHAWSWRGLLPPPDFPAVNGHPAWRNDTIESWAIATGRLDPDTRRPVSRACHPDARKTRK